MPNGAAAGEVGRRWQRIRSCAAVQATKEEKDLGAGLVTGRGRPWYYGPAFCRGAARTLREHPSLRCALGLRGHH